MPPEWGGVDPELEAIFNDDEPDAVELPRKKVPNGDVYEASRAGDVERLRWLLDLGINVNARDAWDSVPLYYACLAGHLDVALILLEQGATCSENTFDGDRCHYAALNLRIRKLLKAYESRPPPLSPLAASLREIFTSSALNRAFLEGNYDKSSADLERLHRLSTSTITSPYSSEKPDVVFIVGGWALQAHRAVLAARSPYFKRKFETDWKNRKEFRFSSRKLSFPALFSLIHYFYTDRLDVAIDAMENLVQVCRVCKCMALRKVLEKELHLQRYATYKAVKKDAEIEDSQKRFVVLGSSLPWEEQLPAAMRRLFRLTLQNSARVNRERDNRSIGMEEANHESIGAEDHYQTSQPTEGEAAGQGRFLEASKHTMQLPSSDSSNAITVESDALHFEEDHADVLFVVAGKRFRCHQAVLATRSEYFRARFFRALGKDSESFRKSHKTENGATSCLAVLEEHELSAPAFTKLLEYIYTDSVEEMDPNDAEEMFDAASRYLLFPLKRALVDVLLPQLESTPPAELCSWLLMADMYGVWKLREHCLDVMALNFELFAATPEFCHMLRSLPPPSGDDAARTSAPTAPGEEERDSPGNLLDDLREKWLEIEGEELDQRDASAVEFDRRLADLVEWAFLDEANMDRDEKDIKHAEI